MTAKRNICSVLALVMLLVTSSCQTGSFKRLSAYDVALGDMLENGRLLPHLRHSEAPVLSMSQLANRLGDVSLVPFATYTIVGDSSESRKLDWIEKGLRRHQADVIALMDPQVHYAGSVSSASIGGGFALGMSSPVYTKSLTGVGCRLAPGAIGFRFDDAGVIEHISDPILYEQGLLEGDSVLTVDGISVKGMLSDFSHPAWSRILTYQPGEELRVVYIRPGTGRLEAVVSVKENELPEEFDGLYLPGRMSN